MQKFRVAFEHLLFLYSRVKAFATPNWAEVFLSDMQGSAFAGSCNVQWQFTSDPQSFIAPVTLNFNQDVWQACNMLKGSPLNLWLCRAQHSGISLRDALCDWGGGGRGRQQMSLELKNGWSVDILHGEQILRLPGLHALRQKSKGMLQTHRARPFILYSTGASSWILCFRQKRYGLELSGALFCNSNGS